MSRPLPDNYTYSFALRKGGREGERERITVIGAIEKLSQLVDERSDTFIDSRRLSTLGFHRRKLTFSLLLLPNSESLVSSSPVYRSEEGGRGWSPRTRSPVTGSGLASLSRNLIKTFNIREIPDVDGTPPTFRSIRINAFPGYVRLHDTFLSTFIYEVNAHLSDKPLRCQRGIRPTISRPSFPPERVS